MTNNELDWIEKQAQLNMDFHLKNIDALAREAHITLSIFVFALPAAVTCAYKWFHQADMTDLAWAMIGVCAYLWFTGHHLLSAVKGRDIQASGNTPKNLSESLRTCHEKTKENVLENVREGELSNLQERIRLNRERSEQSAVIINRCRELILWAPVVFAGLWIIAFIIRSFAGQF